MGLPEDFVLANRNQIFFCLFKWKCLEIGIFKKKKQFLKSNTYESKSG